jgi:septum formation protein
MCTSILLASASPRRRELLERIGIAVEVLPADVDESVLDGEEAVTYATRVAISKARRIAGQHPDRWVLAADTVVEVSGPPMGKAADREEAQAMLRSLRGKTHRVTTAVALERGPTEVFSMAVTTDVTMRDFGEDELQDYLGASEWQGKAGAYAVQGMAAAFVREVRGSITNVIGLPLAEVVSLLAERGVAKPSFQGDPPVSSPEM